MLFGLHLYEDLRTALDPHSLRLSIQEVGDSSHVLITTGLFQTGSIFSERTRINDRKHRLCTSNCNQIISWDQETSPDLL